MWLHHFQPYTFVTVPPTKRVNPVCLELAEKWGANGGGGGSGGCWVFVLLFHSNLPFKIQVLEQKILQIGRAGIWWSWWVSSNSAYSMILWFYDRIFSSAVQFLRSDVLCLAGLMLINIQVPKREKNTSLSQGQSTHMPRKYQDGLFCSSYDQELFLNIILMWGFFAEHVYISYNKVLPNVYVVWTQYGGKKSAHAHVLFSIKRYLKSLWNAAGKWNSSLVCRVDVALLSFWTMCVGGAEESQPFSDSIWAGLSTP